MFYAKKLKFITLRSNPFDLGRPCCYLLAELLLITSIFTAGIGQAQTPPSAGSLQQQIDRDQKSLQQRPPEKPPVTMPLESPAVGPTVNVKSFRFQGNSLLSSEELSAVLAQLTGRPLDFARLQSSAVLIADFYRAKGWMVQAYLPEQDLKEGEVTIAIVEAVFGQVHLIGQQATHLNPQSVLDVIARQLTRDQFLSMSALERALLLADDLPGVSVTGTLTPGQNNGQTDLLVQTVDEPWVTGIASLDNTGSVSTGNLRATASFGLNSPAGLGDASNLSFMSSQGTRYARFSYSIPLDSDGWRIGINASQLDYKLISASYLNLNASGNSTTTGIELNYPIIRSHSVNLAASLSVDEKKYFNVSAGAITSSYSNVPVSLALNGSSFDALGLGGANAMTLALTKGYVNLNGSPNQVSDASTTRSAGDYSKFRYALSRQQQLDQSISLYASLSGQWTGKNLDSSEKFYLGGNGGVRAYPANEGGGSQGQLLSLELRWQLPEGLNFTGFYDSGRILQNVQNNFSGAPLVNRFMLKGTGLSLGWRNSSGVTLQATYSRRMGSNPNAIAAQVNQGADQDGSLIKNRFWLSASLAF